MKNIFCLNYAYAKTRKKTYLGSVASVGLLITATCLPKIAEADNLIYSKPASSDQSHIWCSSGPQNGNVVFESNLQFEEVTDNQPALKAITGSVLARLHGNDLQSSPLDCSVFSNNSDDGFNTIITLGSCSGYHKAQEENIFVTLSFGGFLNDFFANARIVGPKASSELFLSCSVE